MSDVRVDVHMAEVQKVLHDPGFGVELRRRTDETIVAAARDRAPKFSGAGADSIGSELTLTPLGFVCHVTWDKVHYYMRFQDMGTVRMGPKRFLEQAAQQYGGMLTG